VVGEEKETTFVNNFNRLLQLYKQQQAATAATGQRQAVATAATAVTQPAEQPKKGLFKRLLGKMPNSNDELIVIKRKNQTYLCFTLEELGLYYNPKTNKFRYKGKALKISPKTASKLRKMLDV